MINEEFLKEDVGGENIITGQEVADAVGAGEIYRKGKQQEMMDDQLKMEVQKKFKGLVERMNRVAENNKKEIFD